MEEIFFTLVNADNITKLFGLIFIMLLTLGAVDFAKNIEKIGE